MSLMAPPTCDRQDQRRRRASQQSVIVRQRKIYGSRSEITNVIFKIERLLPCNGGFGIDFSRNMPRRSCDLRKEIRLDPDPDAD